MANRSEKRLPRATVACLRASKGRPTLLPRAYYAGLRRDLSLAPSRFGFNASRWSGNLVARHLSLNYGVTISARQCRRILASFVPKSTGTSKTTPVAQTERTEAAAPEKLRSISPYPNLYQQQQALSRLRKLASSGLPASQFTMAMFDLVDDAIPNSECKALHLSGMSPAIIWPWILRGIDWKDALKYQYYVTDRSPEESALVDPLTRRSKPVYRHEEIVLPHFERSDTYNELYRHWGYHHVLYIWALDGHQLVGGLPVWRSDTMRPFTCDDVRFASEASSLIGHALKVARQRESPHAEGGEFMSTGEHPAGMVLIGEDGRLLAIDQTARYIFGQIAAFDGISKDILLNEKVAPLLRHIGKTLQAIFSRQADGGDWLPPPSACLYLHRSGIALRLHGFAAQDDATNRYYTILVEAGELAEQRRRRLMLRYGLSPREVDVLRVLGQGLRGGEAAMALAVEQGTFYKYVRQLSEKLEMRDQPALRSFAREIAL